MKVFGYSFNGCIIANVLFICCKLDFINSSVAFRLTTCLSLPVWWLWLETFSWLWSQVELQYLHDYAGINTSIGLTANPVVNLSGVIGSDAVSLGADVSFDTATGNFTKYNSGLNFTNADLIASLTLWVNFQNELSLFIYRTNKLGEDHICDVLVKIKQEGNRNNSLGAFAGMIRGTLCVLPTTIQLAPWQTLQ